ncbi:MAG TPA: mechanosensitive ion channel protein MscS, partial [Parvularculaceae bacterium]|nr:mechanosensitive ion channel protein MscS [Parvularculaceae bacterium]
MLQDPAQTPPAQPGDSSALDELLGTEELRQSGSQFIVWAREHLLTIDVGVQAIILVAALVPAALFGPQLKKLITSQIAPRAPYGVLRRAAHAFAHIATPIALLATLQAAAITLSSLGKPNAIVGAGVSLLAAWIVIRLVTLVIRSPFWSQVAFYVAWPIAALDAFGLLGRFLYQLDAIAIPLGTDSAGAAISYSALDFTRTLITIAALFWL